MPVAYAVRCSIEKGTIELIEDYSNWSFAQRTLAGRLGLPLRGVDHELEPVAGRQGDQALDTGGAPQ